VGEKYKLIASYEVFPRVQLTRQLFILIDGQQLTKTANNPTETLVKQESKKDVI
jgi:hypothetical protein